MLLLYHTPDGRAPTSDSTHVFSGTRATIAIAISHRSYSYSYSTQGALTEGIALHSQSMHLQISSAKSCLVYGGTNDGTRIESLQEHLKPREG